MRYTLVLLVTACGARSTLDASQPPDAGAPPDGAPAVDASPTPADASPPKSVCAVTDVTQLASTAAELDQLALGADGYVYFHDASGISRVPKGGGGVALIASAGFAHWPDLSFFALDGDTVTWAAPNGAAPTIIKRAPTSGGDATDWQVLAPGFVSVAAGASQEFAWSWAPNPSFVRISGQQIFSATSTPHGIVEVVEGASGSLWVSGHQGIAVWKSDAFQTCLATDAAGLAVDGGTIYYATQNLAANHVIRFDTGGHEGPSPLVLADATAPFGVALDATHVYFTDRTEGRVWRVPKTGGPADLLRSDSTEPQTVGVAVDEGCVYWTTSNASGGHVYAMPR